MGVEVRRGAERLYQLVSRLGDGPTRRSSTVTPTTSRSSSVPMDFRDRAARIIAQRGPSGYPWPALMKEIHYA